MKSYKSILLLVVFVLIGSIKNNIIAQNIFDSIQSEKYAHFLYANQDYTLAHQEFERVLFLTDYRSDSLKLFCVKSLRLSGKYDLAETRIHQFYPKKEFGSSMISREYLNILYKKKDFNKLDFECKELKNLDSSDRLMYSLSTMFLTKNYDKAYQTIEQKSQDSIVAPFLPIMIHSKKMHHKSPLLAGTLSAVIPGLGQTYAGNWKDGLFALIFTGSSGFQAYRGFEKAGVNSVFGWIYSAVFAAFYSANIYGAVKASNKYNFLNHVKISIQVDALMDNYYH